MSKDNCITNVKVTKISFKLAVSALAYISGNVNVLYINT